jgi:hypothetical protein
MLRTAFRHDTLVVYMRNTMYEGVSKRFRTESITKYTLTFGITRCCPLRNVMAAKLIRLTHKIAIQPHLVAESCTICSSYASPENFGYRLIPLLLLRSCQRIPPKRGSFITFRNMVVFYGEGLLASPLNCQTREAPLAGCPRLLIRHIRNCPNLEAVYSSRNLRTRHDTYE